jgi:lipopolysaccharide transport system ATP-binding protein
LSGMAELPLRDRRDRTGSGALRFHGIALRDGNGGAVAALACGMAATIELILGNTTGQKLRNVGIGVGINSEQGQRLLNLGTDLADENFDEWPLGVESVELRFPRVLLAPGRYEYTLYCSVNGEISDWVKSAGIFDVVASDFYGTGRMPERGHFVMEHQFRSGGRTIEALKDLKSEVFSYEVKGAAESF